MSGQAIRLICAAALTLGLAAPLAAQDKARLDAAKAYVSAPAVQLMINDMFSIGDLGDILAAELPPEFEATPAQTRKVERMLGEAMAPLRDDLEQTMIETSTDRFTTDELRALAAFARTTHGASITRKMQPFMQEVLYRMAPAIQEAQSAVMPKILKELDIE